MHINLFTMHSATLVLAEVSVSFETAWAQGDAGQGEFATNTGDSNPFIIPETLVSDTDTLAGHTTYHLIARTKTDYITSIYGAWTAGRANWTDGIIMHMHIIKLYSYRYTILANSTRTLTRGGSLLQRCTVTRRIP